MYTFVVTQFRFGKLLDSDIKNTAYFWNREKTFLKLNIKI